MPPQLGSSHQLLVSTKGRERPFFARTAGIVIATSRNSNTSCSEAAFSHTIFTLDTRLEPNHNRDGHRRDGFSEIWLRLRLRPRWITLDLNLSLNLNPSRGFVSGRFMTAFLNNPG